eukprot:6186173-Pleurochrysis_carterae.AAC.5
MQALPLHGRFGGYLPGRGRKWTAWASKTSAVVDANGVVHTSLRARRARQRPLCAQSRAPRLSHAAALPPPAVTACAQQAAAQAITKPC